MEQYRTGAHTVFDIKYHYVWITKYRYKLAQYMITDEMIKEYIANQSKHDVKDDGFHVEYERLQPVPLKSQL